MVDNAPEVAAAKVGKTSDDVAVSLVMVVAALAAHLTPLACAESAVST